MSNNYHRLTTSNATGQRTSKERKRCNLFFWRGRPDKDEEVKDHTMRVICDMRAFLQKLPPKLNETKRRQKTAELSAKQFLAQGDRESARRKINLAMRFKRINVRWGKFENTIENVILTYEEAILSKTMFDVLGKSEKALEDLLESMNEENVVTLMNKLNEQMREVVVVSDVLAEPTDCLQYIDDEDVNAELERLENEIKIENCNIDSDNNNNNVDIETKIFADIKSKSPKKIGTGTRTNKPKKAIEKRKKITE